MLEVEFVCPECNHLVSTDEVQNKSDELNGVRWVRFHKDEGWRQVSMKLIVKCSRCGVYLKLFV